MHAAIRVSAGNLAREDRFVQPVGMKHFLVAFAATLPMTILADGGLPNQPYIYVEGKAEIEKPADMVTLNFTEVGRNLDQAKANQEVQGRSNKVLALLDSKKIAEKDVVAGDLSSEAEYEETQTPSQTRGKFVGYNVKRAFSVRVRDVTAFAMIADEVLGMGGCEFSGINAALSNEKEVENQVWEKALANARQQAEETAKAAGIKIDSIFAISPVAFPQIHSKIFGEGAEAFAYSPAQASAKVVPTQYRLAPISVTQSVHVIYLISPLK
jgi:uncharacterized protein YggE